MLTYFRRSNDIAAASHPSTIRALRRDGYTAIDGDTYLRLLLAAHPGHHGVVVPPAPPFEGATLKAAAPWTRADALHAEVARLLALQPSQPGQQGQPGQIRQHLDIGVDFDGTLATDRYPQIGEPDHELITALLDLQREGHTLVLWTCRRARYASYHYTACSTRPPGNHDCARTEDAAPCVLTQALQWCASFGLEFAAVNANLPHRIAQFGSDTRKGSFDLYIGNEAYAWQARATP